MSNLMETIQEQIDYLLEEVQTGNPEESLEKIKTYIYHKQSPIQTDLAKHYAISEEELIRNKPILLLTLLSNFYEFIYYREVEDDFFDILTDLENPSVHAKEYLRMLKNPRFSDFLEKVIQENLYIDGQNYISRYLAHRKTLTDGRAHTLLRINPFTALTFLTFPDDEYYSTSEMLIHEIASLYLRPDNYETDAFESEFYNDDVQYESSETESLHEELYRVLLDEIITHYRVEGQLSSDQVLLYMASYYFESKLWDTVPARDETLIHALSQLPQEEILAKMYDDESFYVPILRHFLRDSTDIEEVKLLAIRSSTKAQNQLTTVRKLNPFYEEEEQKWTLRKTVIKA